MMESGHLVDEVADVVQTQVIAHQARASIRNREEVPLYVQTEEDRPPVWMENLLVETGLAEPPGTDSRYVSEDSKDLWKGIKTGAVTLDAESKVRTSLHQAGLLAASILAVICPAEGYRKHRAALRKTLYGALRAGFSPALDPNQPNRAKLASSALAPSSSSMPRCRW